MATDDAVKEDRNGERGCGYLSPEFSFGEIAKTLNPKKTRIVGGVWQSAAKSEEVAGFCLHQLQRYMEILLCIPNLKTIGGNVNPIGRVEPLTIQCPGTQTRSFYYVTESFYVELVPECDYDFYEMSQVDGLIRLMEGPNTGPINLEKPSHLSEYIYIPGEFTMTEVVETVKEVGF
ncbi:hypothetical protein ACSQ67_016400 [Phaseolus vulgaris]